MLVLLRGIAAMIKTRVCWQFNNKFRIQRTFKSKVAALRYIKFIDNVWGIKAQMKVIQ